jgi:hypothetical protein
MVDDNVIISSNIAAVHFTLGDLVRIYPDGRVERLSGFTTNEAAALEFWKAVEVLFSTKPASTDADLSKIETAIAFFQSCIKSGEPWTDTCEEMKRQAFASARRIRTGI